MNDKHWRAVFVEGRVKVLFTDLGKTGSHFMEKTFPRFLLGVFQLIFLCDLKSLQMLSITVQGGCDSLESDQS